MKKLFEENEINGIRLRNRFVRSATFEGLADMNGCYTPEMTRLAGELAAGGVGLIITGHCYVQKTGRASRFQAGIDTDEFIPALKTVTDRAHENQGKIFIQLAHAGIFAHPPDESDLPLAVSETDAPRVGKYRIMNSDDIQGVIQAFVQSAGRAKEAGFDGVQIHAAHGYLLSQFLSPLFNRRKDSYGGTLSNRLRIIVQIVDGIKSLTGTDFPVIIKMNCQDFEQGGFTIADAIKAGTLLSAAGIDAFEVSGGLLTSRKKGPSRSGIRFEQDEAYFSMEAALFKEKVNVPVILVGGMRSYSVAENIVKKKIADYVSMSRPFIREPGLIARWKSGDRKKSFCNSDNLCFRPALSGGGVFCVTAKRKGAVL